MSLDPQTSKLSDGKIKMTWTPDPSCFGYRFYRDGVPVSKGTKPEQRETTFARETDGKQHVYGIAKAVEWAVETSKYPADVPPTPPGQTTITPAQFQALVTTGATILDKKVAGDGSVGPTNVTLRNVSFDGTLFVAPGADDFSWIGGGGREFKHFGPKRGLYESLVMDGKNQTSNCKAWGWEGRLPSYVVRKCEFRNYFNSAPDQHTEGFYMGSCESGIVEDCLFEHNGGPGLEHGTGHILIEAFGDPWSDKGFYCVRRNTFGQTDGAYSIQVKEVFTSASKVYVDPRQPTVKPLVTYPEKFARPCPG